MKPLRNAIHSVIREFLGKGETLAKELGIYHPYKYVNYAEGFQDVVSGYGEENVKGLQKVQRKYDPEGIYAKGGFAGGLFKLNDKPIEKMAEEFEVSAGKTKAQVHVKDEL